MRSKNRNTRRAGPWLVLGGLLTGSAWAGTSVQPGFYYHEPDGIALRLSGIRSGELCVGGDNAVCETAARVVITGGETCEYSPGTDYPCTRFGYEFDYRDADPGSRIDCRVTRQDPMGRKTAGEYSLQLDDSAGRIFYPTYRTYAPVEKRAILSEVHECNYRGKRLATIEYIIYYEPETASAAAGGGQPAGQYFPEVPDACAAPHLTEDRALGLLGATQVKPSVANEHIAQLQSQCIYSARQGPARQIGFVYKFMLSDLFDVDKLDPQQVQFNATFATGGAELKQTRNELGDRAFVFLKGDRTTLLVITGIRGRQDFAGRPQEFIANYYLDQPGLTHEARAGLLIDAAEQDLRAWSASGP